MYTRKISRAYVRLESPAERSFRRLPKHVQASYIHQAQSMGADPISVYLQSCTPTLDSSAPSAVSYVQNLENGIMEVRHAPEEGAEMARERIRRRVVINGKQQWITGLTEQEYAENLFDAMSGNAKAASAQKHNFQEYASGWFETYSKPNVETTTALTYERQLRRHIYPILGEKCIEDIEVGDIQRLFNEMDGAKTTKDKARIVLNMVLDFAVEDGIISRNPAKSKRLKVTGKQSGETEPYTREQMRFLAQRIPMVRNEMDRTYLAIQMAHPMRLEEVLGLKWSDVDLENGLFHIRRAVTHPDRNQPEVKETKTDASRRSLAIVPSVAAILKPGDADHFVVGGEMPLSYTQVRSMCRRIQKNTGFEESSTPIRFRTTVLTDIYDQTKDIKQAQTAAGHTTSAMTLKHYVKGRGDSHTSAAVIADAYGM